MFPRLAMFLVVSSVGVLSTSGLGIADEKQKAPAAVIVSPKEGAKVERFDEVEGRLNAKEGWPVVLVKPLVGDEPWWVQPPVEEVKDGVFTIQVHFGNDRTPPNTKFRVVIVVAKNKQEARKLKAGMTLESLPAGLPRSEFVTVIRNGKAQDEVPSKPKSRSVRFAGQTWEVKSAVRYGPGPNAWSDAEENVWVDKDGHLHLAITKRDDRWQCAEVIGPSLGYGEYRWVVSGNLATLDPHVVLGLFVYKDDDHEIDFELARWGDADKENAQFVVQPHGKDSMYRFDTGKTDVLTCRLIWSEAAIRWQCWAGEDTTKEPLADWKYTGRKVPRAEGLQTRCNLWLFRGKPPTAIAKQHVVIRSFRFEAALPSSIPNRDP